MFRRSLAILRRVLRSLGWLCLTALGFLLSGRTVEMLLAGVLLVGFFALTLVLVPVLSLIGLSTQAAAAVVGGIVIIGFWVTGLWLLSYFGLPVPYLGPDRSGADDYPSDSERPARSSASRGATAAEIESRLSEIRTTEAELSSAIDDYERFHTTVDRRDIEAALRELRLQWGTVESLLDRLGSGPSDDHGGVDLVACRQLASDARRTLDQHFEALRADPEAYAEGGVIDVASLAAYRERIESEFEQRDAD